MAVATVLLNLSASNITIGKAEYRGTCVPRNRESVLPLTCTLGGWSGWSLTTDLAWDGHALIHENNDLLAESSGSRTTNKSLSPTSTWNACAGPVCD